MTILCIILAAYCCIHNNVILLTAPGSNTGVFVKVSRHPTALEGFKRLISAFMVFYTFLGFAARFKAYRALKTWIMQRNAPRQGTQERNRHELQPVRISCSPSGVMLSTLGAAQDQPQLEPSNRRNRVH